MPSQGKVLVITHPSWLVLEAQRIGGVRGPKGRWKGLAWMPFDLSLTAPPGFADETCNDEGSIPQKLAAP